MEDIIEKKVVLEVVAPEAAKTVGDLKNNIKLLKEGWTDANGAFHKGLNDLKIGSEEYQKQLGELKLNQNMLRDANFATASSFETVANQAAGTGESYNALVHRLAALKEEYRTLDPTIEGQGARMGELAGQIDEVNSKLKAYDASIGNFQRNVGNYTASITAALKDIPPFAGKVKNAFDNVDKSMKLLSGNPIFGALTLLLPLILKIAGAVKENEKATEALSKAMKALQPVFDAVSKVIEKLADWVAKAVEWFVSLSGESGETFKKIIAGATGVGNVLLQSLLTPIRTVVDAFKGLGKIIKDVFTGDWKSIKADATEAAQGIGDAIVKGVSFKANFEAGKALGEQFVAGLGSSSTKKKAAAAGRDIGKEIADGLLEGLSVGDDGSLEAWEKAQEKALEAAKRHEENRLKEVEKGTARRKADAEMQIDDARELEARKFKIEQEGLKKRAELSRQFYHDALERGDVQAALAYQEQAQDLEYQIEYEGFMRRKALREQEAEDRRTLLQGMVSATTSILGALADAYEAAGDMSEAEAHRMKNLRVAATVIETIAGAVSAFMSTWKSELPLTAKSILAPVNATAVLAAGYAQIAKMQSTDATGSGAFLSTSGMRSAAVSAPAPVQQVPVTRSLTSASEEERLNQMASTKRVVLVTSDLDAYGKRVEMVNSETEL